MYFPGLDDYRTANPYALTVNLLVMRWVLDNKEWLFSGVGVAIMGGLLTLFLRRRVVPAQTNSSTVAGNSMIASPVATGSNITQNVTISLQPNVPPRTQQGDEYSERPTPQEINSQLTSFPPYQYRDAERAYRGIKVTWSVTFQSLDDIKHYGGLNIRNDDTHIVFLSYGHEEQGTCFVMANINIEQVPRLKVAHRGTRMRVSGTIESTGSTTRLMDASLWFVE
jgi:hypothetical protein